MTNLLRSPALNLKNIFFSNIPSNQLFKNSIKCRLFPTDKMNSNAFLIFNSQFLPYLSQKFLCHLHNTLKKRILVTEPTRIKNKHQMTGLFNFFIYSSINCPSWTTNTIFNVFFLKLSQTHTVCTSYLPTHLLQCVYDMFALSVWYTHMTFPMFRRQLTVYLNIHSILFVYIESVLE